MIWSELCKNTAFALLSIIPKMNMNSNSVQLLEFKYILEDKTFKPWLIKIDSDIHLHFNSDDAEEDIRNNENKNKNSRGVADFKDMMIFCLLFRIFQKLESRLTDIKRNETNEEQVDFDRLLNMGRTHNLLNTSIEVKLPEANEDSIDKAIKDAVNISNQNGNKKRNKRIILSTVINEIHKALHSPSPVKSDK